MIEEYRYVGQYNNNNYIDISEILFIHRENNLIYFYTYNMIYFKKEVLYYYIIENLLTIIYLTEYMEYIISNNCTYIILDDNSFLNKKKYGMLHKNVIINLI